MGDERADRAARTRKGRWLLTATKTCLSFVIFSPKIPPRIRANPTSGDSRSNKEHHALIERDEGGLPSWMFVGKSPLSKRHSGGVCWKRRKGPTGGGRALTSRSSGL